jgi:dTDP-4-dehydrorhamnose 3,5-epimerase
MPMPVQFNPTRIPAVMLVETGRIQDERGFFSEAYSEGVWSKAGFSSAFVQDNLSKSAKGTLRGMHYQIVPHAMGKFVQVVSGAVFDVAVDLRRSSPTFGQWVGHTLTGDRPVAMWIPPGFAHGFLALEDDSFVYYKCTCMHTPEAERSLHYADPQVAVAWPIEPAIVSKKDHEAPTLDRAEYNFDYTP